MTIRRKVWMQPVQCLVQIQLALRLMRRWLGIEATSRVVPGTKLVADRPSPTSSGQLACACSSGVLPFFSTRKLRWSLILQALPHNAHSVMQLLSTTASLLPLPRTTKNLMCHDAMKEKWKVQKEK